MGVVVSSPHQLTPIPTIVSNGNLNQNVFVHFVLIDKMYQSVHKRNFIEYKVMKNEIMFTSFRFCKKKHIHIK
jgi:hypothetical protein